MKFIQFKIKNYKGIEDITFDLDKSPEANIYTLVGLNESGKTTILEAINHFNLHDIGVNTLELADLNITDQNSFIPISQRDNFNDDISIIVTLKLEDTDWEKLNTFVSKGTSFRKLEKKETLTYFRYYKFENSLFKELDRKWSIFRGILKDEPTDNYIYIDDTKYKADNAALAVFCRKLIPNILYFPNFLFDFPSRIYLETKSAPNFKENFYKELIQDILNSLNNNTNIQTHLVDRIRSTERSHKQSMERLLQLMGKKVTEVVFDAWNKIFKRQIKDTRINIKHDIDGENMPFLEFEIEANDGIYHLNERSLGFKWFFIFLLFTQFRPHRKDAPSNIIFLFDEPASNLHSSAQKQLLKSFENLINNCKIIYTTHSHHLINPNWLESTYVVKNTGLDLDDPESYNVKKTNITIEPYREFASKHPHNTAYFQPILDVLNYVPSDLENIPDCILLEGKNDYYNLAYFASVIFNSIHYLNMSPSTGSGNLDTLISLYIGWGKEFIILLDSDAEGIKQKERYIEKFGLIVERRIYLLSEIDITFEKKAIEALYDESDKLAIQQKSYPLSSRFNKTHFNRAIQESLINKRYFDFSETTLDNMKKILDFLKARIDELTGT